MPNENYNGDVNLTYVITDGVGGADLKSFALVAVNDAPEHTAGDVVTLAVLKIPEPPALVSPAWPMGPVAVTTS